MNEVSLLYDFFHTNVFVFFHSLCLCNKCSFLRPFKCQSCERQLLDSIGIGVKQKSLVIGCSHYSGLSAGDCVQSEQPVKTVALGQLL